ERRERLGGCERAMPRAMDERLPQQLPLVDDPGVGLLILVQYQPVTRGVDGQHGQAAKVAIEDDVLRQIVNRRRARVDAWRGAERRQILLQVEPGGEVERTNLISVDRSRKLPVVVHVAVPRRVAARTELQLRAEGEQEREVHLLVPQELVELAGAEISPRWFRRSWNEPARQVADGRHQGQPG